VSPVRYELGFHIPEDGILQVPCPFNAWVSGEDLMMAHLKWSGMKSVAVSLVRA
jgi:hypothetical protein